VRGKSIIHPNNIKGGRQGACGWIFSKRQCHPHGRKGQKFGGRIAKERGENTETVEHSDLK